MFLQTRVCLNMFTQDKLSLTVRKVEVKEELVITFFWHEESEQKCFETRHPPFIRRVHSSYIPVSGRVLGCLRKSEARKIMSIKRIA